MLHRALLVALLAFGVAVPALADPITVTYTFTGSPGTQASEAVDSHPIGALFSDITRGPGVIANAGMNSINSRAWTTGASPDLLNDFYEWTITPDPGYELDVTDLNFTFRSSPTGPDIFEIRSSVNAFASPFAAISIVNDSDANFRVGFGNPSGLGGALDLTNPVTFRIYGYSAEGSSGTFRLGIDASSVNAGLPANVEIGGDLTAIPEPASLLLFATGVAGVIANARRKKQPGQYAHTRVRAG